MCSVYGPQVGYLFLTHLQNHPLYIKLKLGTASDKEKERGHTTHTRRSSLENESWVTKHQRCGGTCLTSKETLWKAIPKPKKRLGMLSIKGGSLVFGKPLNVIRHYGLNGLDTGKFPLCFPKYLLFQDRAVAFGEPVGPLF